MPGPKTPKLRRAFLVDGTGALVSAGFLGGVLPALREHVGMPAHLLYVLAGVALLFAANALLAYRFGGERAGSWLKAIALANLAYCGLTGILVALHFDQLTALGVAYFVGEIGIIVALVGFEGWSLKSEPPPA